MLTGKTAAGGAAGLDSLEFLAVLDAAADFVNDIAKQNAHGHLDNAGVLDIPGQGKHLGSGAFLRAELAVPVGTVEDNRRNIGQCLYIINDSRLIKQSALKGERRFLAGLASAPFNGGEKRGLLTTDEGTGSNTDFQIEGKIGSQDIAAQESGFPCLGDGIG